MEYRYKIGEAVKVRDDLMYGAFYNMMSGPRPTGNNNIATPNMAECHGQIVHIKGYSNSQYLVEETGEFRWTDDMFEKLEDNECYCESLL